MSFFTALADLAGGFGAGRQQRLTNQQTQQQLDQQQAQSQADFALRQQELALDQQRAKQEADVYQRSIAPIQPLPPSLQQISPNNKGKVPLGPDAVAQAQIDHLYKVAEYYGAQPSAAAQNLAGLAADRARSLESILKQQQSNLNTLGREESMRQFDITHPLPITPYQQFEEGVVQQYGPPGLPRTNDWLTSHGYQPEIPGSGSGTANEGKLVTQLNERASRAATAFGKMWGAMTFVPMNGKLPALKPDGSGPYSPGLSTQDQATFKQLQPLLQNSKDPRKDADDTMRGLKLPKTSPLRKIINAYVYQLQAQNSAAAQAQKYTQQLEQGQNGGSYAPGNPPPPQ